MLQEKSRPWRVALDVVDQVNRVEVAVVVELAVVAVLPDVVLATSIVPKRM